MLTCFENQLNQNTNVFLFAFLYMVCLLHLVYVVCMVYNKEIKPQYGAVILEMAPSLSILCIFVPLSSEGYSPDHG